jgi:hypothetical protein
MSGLLEMADREFDSLTYEIDEYAIEVDKKTKEGELDIEINSTSVFHFLQNKILSKDTLSVDMRPITEVVISELSDFGVRTLAGLNDLLNVENLKAMTQLHPQEATTIGIVRYAMMLSDIDLYFEKCWNNHWNSISINTLNILKAKYDAEKVDSIISDYGIDTDYQEP